MVKLILQTTDCVFNPHCVLFMKFRLTCFIPFTFVNKQQSFSNSILRNVNMQLNFMLTIVQKINYIIAIFYDKYFYSFLTQDNPTLV